MMKKALLLGLLLVLIVPQVQAQEQIVSITGFPLVGTCVNNVTLTKTITLNISNEIIEITQENVTCPFGCVENISQFGDECRDHDPTKAGYTGFFLLGFAVFFLAMAKTSKHPMTILFTFIALFAVISSVWVTSQITETHFPQVSSIVDVFYLIAIFSTMIALGWMLLGIIIQAFRAAPGQKKHKFI